MEELDSFWFFQESNAVEELKQKLQYTTYELELTRKETNEEIRKSNERIKKLCQLLQTTCKERDEAKSQLKKLQQIIPFFNKFNENVVNDRIIPATAPFSPDSPLLTTNYPTKTNSSFTESSSFSLETHNNNAVDSLSSPDSCNVVSFNARVAGKSATRVDQESLIIGNLAKGRPLPTKGRLLQAVIEAGPLLSTLMVAGSLPQWRNPPGVLTHQIPPVILKGCVGVESGSGLGSGQGINKQIVSSSSGNCQNSMLDFGSGSCFMDGRMRMNSGVGFDCQVPKRQRII